MSALPQIIPEEVLAAVREGHHIEAIRLLREATGFGLKQAKDAIEALARGETPNLSAAPDIYEDDMTPPARPWNGGMEMPESARQAIMQGQRIEAVRLLREATGIGLADAVHAVDAWAQTNGIALPQPRRNSAFMWIVLILVGVALAVIWLQN